MIEAVAAFDNVADAPEVKSEDNRKLSVTLFTDIVGSTERLLSVGDEEWRKLLDQHDEIARSAVEKYKGRIVKNTGDGLLVIFDGPVRSLLCAQELIAALKAIGLPIRAGVHIGEVVNRGGDITGIAVNIASRVMDIAVEGEVLVTKTRDSF
ncbi:adenylate/guanylate cyclase domain-containing protein [Shewanella sp.]|uniref:adenylate/guanylate cyclase domain-containing protein n=1 Tax=Shewanella sp. TaxID=50422 RepID=UPI004047A7DD